MGLIYSASLFQPENHHGVLIPICRSLSKKLPDGVAQALVSDHPLRDLVKPGAALLGKYNARKVEWGREWERYRALGYDDPLSFVDHCQVCGSLQKALDTPEPYLTLGENPEDFYIKHYRDQLKPKAARIRSILETLAEATDDVTLLCWEKAGEFCHRNLVMQCVMAWVPAAYGGLDVPLETRLTG